MSGGRPLGSKPVAIVLTALVWIRQAIVSVLYQLEQNGIATPVGVNLEG
jgi:hypothetical protein